MVIEFCENPQSRSYIVSRKAIQPYIYSWQFIALVTDESTDILASLQDVANLQIIKGNKAPRGDTPWSDCIQNCIVLCED